MLLSSSVFGSFIVKFLIYIVYEESLRLEKVRSGRYACLLFDKCRLCGGLVPLCFESGPPGSRSCTDLVFIKLSGALESLSPSLAESQLHHGFTTVIHIYILPLIRWKFNTFLRCGPMAVHLIIKHQITWILGLVVFVKVWLMDFSAIWVHSGKLLRRIPSGQARCKLATRVKVVIASGLAISLATCGIFRHGQIRQVPRALLFL